MNDDFAALKTYHDDDADLSLLKEKKIAIIGFGSQGKAQAMNLRDSGMDVIIGLSSDNSMKAARNEGFTVYEVAEASSKGDIIVFLFPDQKHKEVYETDIAHNISQGNVLIFAHGLSVHFGLVNPPADTDVIMVAPHAPGAIMLERFKQGKGVACFIGVHNDFSGKAKETALAYAKGIGCTRAGVFETTFEHEAVGDLFGEQVALCGGLSELLETAFETLVLGGLPAANAYLECVQQLDLVVELIKKHGIAGMYNRISDVAEYGSYSIKGRVINELSRRAMRSILQEIQEGKFIKKMMKDYEKGYQDYIKLKEKNEKHPINEVGKVIRERMDD
ncbi:MAG: ketol-acid reductoisomerase [candidate division Zixibacteria bacterium]|nr:ketol-acid reductoisomerase [candidate division Zixibacteria bacterium]